MADREPLLPKGPSPSGFLRDEITNENYQGRRYESEHPSISNRGYSALSNTPPMLEQTPGLFQGNPVLIDPNHLQDNSERVPSNYSGYAWLSLLFCCFPLSIAAIYKSDKVMKCIKRGDIEEAWRHAIAAKKLSALAIIYGILFIIIAISLYFVLFYLHK